MTFAMISPSRGCVTDMAVLYECICSDHHPLLFSIDFGIVPAYDSQGITCNDPNCLNHSNRGAIDELYDYIVSTLKSAVMRSYRLVNI